MPHQEEAIKWMNSVVTSSENFRGIKGGILEMEKGLGKTITTLSFALSLPKKEGTSPMLIVCKKMFMGDTWKREIERRFLSKIKVLYLHGDYLSSEEISALSRDQISSYHLVITTYEFCMKVNREFQYWSQATDVNEPNLIRHRTEKHLNPKVKRGERLVYEISWRMVFCDESQNFANGNSKIYKSMMALVADYRWCLSGSPVKNYDTDLLSQLRFVGYDSVTKVSEWRNYGKSFFTQHRLSERIFQIDYMMAKVDMPMKEEYESLVTLSGLYQNIYQTVLKSLKFSYEESHKWCLLALLSKIRQCLVAPYLMTGQAKRNKYIKRGLTPKTGKENAEIEEILGSQLEKILPKKLRDWCLDKRKAGWEAPKIAKAFELIDQILETGQKVIVFSTQVIALDLIADRLTEEYSEITKFRQLDGSLSSKKRDEALNTFRTDEDCHILLASYKVCSEGLNLTEANYCILLDFWWNNVTRDQAVARLWRIGQTEKVCVFSIFAKNTLDVRISEICKTKEVMAAKYKNGKNFTNISSTVGRLLSDPKD